MVKLLLLAALILPNAALAADAPKAPGRGCYSARAQEVSGSWKPGYHRLDKLPPAAAMLPVIHSVDGCQKPVIVRYGIGGDPALGGGQGR